MTISVAIPKLPFWLMRLVAQDGVQVAFLSNAALFAAWYASVGSVFMEWPEEVHDIQKANKQRPPSFERICLVLSTVKSAFDSEALRDPEYARQLFEGFAVHKWATNHPDGFARRVATAVEFADYVEEGLLGRTRTTFTDRLEELAKQLQLSALEQDLLTFGAAYTVKDELRVILDQLDKSKKLSPSVFARMFKVSVQDLLVAVAEDSPLVVSGLLSTTGKLVRVPVLSEFWVRLLAEAEDGVAAALTEPVRFRATADMPARLDPEDADLAAQVLSNASEPGVNLLLYGAAGLDKQAVLKELVSRTGRKAYRVAPLSGIRSEVSAAVYVAQRSLAQYDADAILVVDRPSEVLEMEARQAAFSRVFGLNVGPGEEATRAAILLNSNPVPTSFPACCGCVPTPDWRTS